MSVDWTKALFDPDEDGTYLVTMDGSLIGQEEPFTSICGFQNGKWDEGNNVLSWAPLPDPDLFWMPKEKRRSIFK